MMMSNLGRFAIVLFLATLSNPVLARISAYLNQDTFYEGDAITLNIESDINTDARPDLTVLENNFVVLSTGQNSQINIINGKRSFKKIWIIELKPKKKGVIEVPAISVGNEKTEPLNIKVAALPPEVKVETDKHIFIETSVGITDNETYVQQQIPYMVKFYFDSAMQSGEISQPSVENAVVEELTKDKRYSVMRGGKKFNVVEKHFTISPEKSGLLHIPSTSVSGRIALSGGDSPKLRRRMDSTDMLNKFFNGFSNDPFFKDSFGDDFFGRRRTLGPTQPFIVKSKAIEVNVMPVPKSFTGLTWLPAEELSIRDSWTRTPPELKVGEPVTRTLVLRAKGLGGSQIPTIDIPKPEGMKIYPQQPSSKTHTDGVTLIGRQYFDITYIPQKEGKIIIPKIKVDWWNTKTKQQEAFTLPAWNLNVAPGVSSHAEPEDALSETMPNATPIKNKKVSTIKQAAPPESNTAIMADSWRWKIPVLIMILFLAIAGLFHAFKKYRKDSSQVENQRKATIDALKESVIQACDNDDKHVAAKALLKLAQVQWSMGDSRIQNLGALALLLDKGVAVIKELEESLYSSRSHQWNGEKLKSLIEADLIRSKHQASAKTHDVLEPLYPV